MVAFRFGAGGASLPWGLIVATVGKSADKVYYDTLVCRRSTYWGIFGEGHSSGRVGENQRDAEHSRAEAKSDALTHGAWHAGVRFLIFPRTLRPLTPDFATHVAECRLFCQNRRPSLAECFQMFMHDFIHGCISVIQVTEY